MQILDATVITTALPAIAADFHTPPPHLSLGVSAYLIAMTVFVPLSGWATERYGARTIFSGSIVVFALASALCALCQDLTQFTLARILQGIGGAMMVPVGRLVVLRDTPKSEMVHAIAILTWPALVAPLIGPVMGGWIATHWSWHWIFLLNLPLSAIAIMAALRLIPHTERSEHSFDVKGFILSGLGVGLTMTGIEFSSRDDIALWFSIALLIAGLLMIWQTVLHLKQTPKPLFNLAPIAIRTFRVSIVGGSLFRIAISSVPFLLPLMFQVGFGFSAVTSGALLLWLFAGNLAMKTVTTPIMNRFGFKKVLVINGLMVVIGFVAMAYIAADTPKWLIATLLFVSGMNRSMHFTAMNTIGFADIPAKQMPDANTLQAVILQMNLGAGIAIGALSLAVASMLNGGVSAHATAADFALSMWFIAGIALLAIIDCARLPANAGASVLKQRRH
ncbi:major facilitator transporter [Shewanella mangrovi]|uniref:Major facilitator transporter n=2 Tax=Shewanella mangrovi TaxID=1515746 RepID=A0A094JFJ9_9GAMM|nr:major facilitator transporter [Shewanella mangrovi]